MFRVTVLDTDTGETTTLDYEHVELTQSTGYRRLDPDGGGPRSPESINTGAKIGLLKCWSGEAAGMRTYEDFVNFTDDTGGAPDTPGEPDA